jgi:hypothetical protein
MPVRAIVQPLQVPVQALLQHTPSTQKPRLHWSLAEHGWAVALVGVQVPPLLAVSQKSPEGHWRSVVQAVQTPIGVPTQYMLRQSVTSLQCKVSAQGEHDPPQSTSVSSPSCTPSAQCAELHLPIPSQTVPPLSLHDVPLGWSAVVHALDEQETTAQVVVLLVQSLVCRQATQAPLPSHTVPPAELHLVPAAASTGVQAPPTHETGAHVVLAMPEQSLVWRQATHLPLPSHCVPPLSLQVMPEATLVVPQTPSVQVACWQVVMGCVHSAETMQATHLPLPSQWAPPLLVHLVSSGRGVPLQHPAVHAAWVQSFGAVQLSAALHAVHVITPPVPIMVVVPVVVPPPVLEA